MKRFTTVDSVLAEAQLTLGPVVNVVWQFSPLTPTADVNEMTSCY